MSNRLHKYRLYEGAIRRLLIFTGLWPRPNPRFYHGLLTLVHILAALTACCAILNFTRLHFDNLNHLMRGLSLGLGYLTMIQKTICLTVYRKRLGKLHASMSGAFGQDYNDEQLRTILLSPLLSFYRPALTLSIVTYLAIVMYWLTPVILIANQHSRGVDVVKYILPFPAVYPWHTDVHTWRYPAHYAFEIYCGICLGSFTLSIDALFGYYIFQITGQLRTLSHRIRNFSSRQNYQKVISECVARHHTLAKCQDHLQRIYGPIVLWMLVTNAMIICALIYQAFHMSAAKATLIIFYVVMKSVQTLIYGWFGSVLTTENDKFRDAIYASDWTGVGKKRLMTDIFIMMTYKPLVLRACGLSTISVDMFIAVSNTAISYFFMLRTLEERKNT